MHAWIVHNQNRVCLNALKWTFPVVNNFTGKQHRIRHNNDIYITSEMALVSYARAFFLPSHEHLRAHKAILYSRHSFLYFIDFIHEFHTQIINFV